MITVFSRGKTPLEKPDPKTASLLRVEPMEALGSYAPPEGAPPGESFSYIDISGLEKGELKKFLGLMKKRCAGAPWGVIDPGDEAEDPAEFFFGGASDYLGKRALAGIGKKRFAAAGAFFLARQGAAAVMEQGKTAAGSKGDEKKNGAAKKTKGALHGGTAKLPGAIFPGWASLKPGTAAPFFFLFVALEEKELRGRIGESAFSAVRKRLTDHLKQRLVEAKALLWMESEAHCLFLVPPQGAKARAAVTEAVRFIISAPLIGAEHLGINLPVNFIFALHYGKTDYRAPGKTGMVIADAVNFIFHLGTRRAEGGRLTISGDTPREAVPPGFRDLFVEAGEFEGRNLQHSRRFNGLH